MYPHLPRMVSRRTRCTIAASSSESEKLCPLPGPDTELERDTLHTPSMSMQQHCVQSRLSTHLGGFLRPVTGEDLRPARPLARVMEGRGWRTTGNRGPGAGASTAASSLASACTEALFTNLSEC